MAGASRTIVRLAPRRSPPRDTVENQDALRTPGTRKYCCDQCNDRAAAAAYYQRKRPSKRNRGQCGAHEVFGWSLDRAAFVLGGEHHRGAHLAVLAEPLQQPLEVFH